MGTKRINRILNLVVIMALMLAWLPVTSVGATSVAGAHLAQMLPVENLLNSDGTLNTRTGVNSSLDLRGWNVTLDSSRGPILTRTAPAAPNADTWSAFANHGLTGNNTLSHVSAIAVVGSDLYVGGNFTQTKDGTVTNLNHIARYSGGTWSALANHGLTGNNSSSYVSAIAVVGSDLYVGGLFQQTKDGTVKNLSNIARYSGGTWSALANHGLDGYVGALAVSGSDLYVGGQFTQTADGTVKNLGNIARYTSGGTWSAFANHGLNNSVYALAVMGSDLYVGGIFTQTIDGTVKNLNDIARYSGGIWSPLANNGLGNDVYALAVIGSDLYVGGIFDKTNDGAVTNLNDIARYSGGAWSGLANNGLNSNVQALAVIGSDLYVGGSFTQTKNGTVNLNYMAMYSGGTWSPLANNGLNGVVFALAVSGSDLYAGGAFSQTNDGTVTNLNYIAKLGIPAALDHSVYLPLVIR
jgi:trimeric autotransporter adhesin